MGVESDLILLVRRVHIPSTTSDRDYDDKGQFGID
jgi:hypothetical protein